MATKNEIFGRIGEKFVEIELLKRNINFWEMAGNNPYFDLIVETKSGLKKVQIKTSRLNKKGKFQYYLMNSAGEFDYLILVTINEGEKNKFYIIPEKEVELHTGINMCNGKNKFSKFLENWDVLSN